MKTRIKICGITRVDDALAAVQAGADAIGLIFYRGSKRFVALDDAVSITRALPPFVTTVALFVNEKKEKIEKIISILRPDLVQFHGDESEPFCAQFGIPYLRAIRVGNGKGISNDLLQFADRFQSAKSLLLDTLSEKHYGGSGKIFDWEIVPHQLHGRIILSGGLNPENVTDAIRIVRPWAVDVSSGVERSEGIKDHQKIIQFIEAVRHADVRSS